jgi:hypothetical protein
MHTSDRRFEPDERMRMPASQLAHFINDTIGVEWAFRSARGPRTSLRP